MPDLTFAEVGQILRLLQAIEGSDVELEWGDLRLRVRRDGGAEDERPARAAESRPVSADEHAEPAPIPSPAAVDAPRTPPSDDSGHGIPDHWVAIESPMVGTFYRSPKPGEPAYVEMGDVVAAGDTVALVEVMKLFTELKTEVAGKVARVDADDTALVEFGQPLIWIEPS